LDSCEGIGLMCLAEVMLRIPNTEARNQLIRDKIVDADRRAHFGNSPSMFVSAAAWGLLATGTLPKQPDENALAEALTSVVRKGSEAVVRAGIAYAMRMLSKQFVTAQTIEEAIGAAKVRQRGDMKLFLGHRLSRMPRGDTLRDITQVSQEPTNSIDSRAQAHLHVRPLLACVSAGGCSGTQAGWHLICAFHRGRHAGKAKDGLAAEGAAAAPADNEQT
jgi:hypothetical protein